MNSNIVVTQIGALKIVRVGADRRHTSGAISLVAHRTRATRASVRQKALLSPFVRLRKAVKAADALTSLDTPAERAKRFYTLLNANRIVMP